MRGAQLVGFGFLLGHRLALVPDGLSRRSLRREVARGFGPMLVRVPCFGQITMKSFSVMVGAPFRLAKRMLPPAALPLTS